MEVQVAYETSAVELRIRDDGRGFDPNQTPPGHYGLSMMRERAAAIGAARSIYSQPGHGAEISVRWTAPPQQKAN